MSRPVKSFLFLFFFISIFFLSIKTISAACASLTQCDAPAGQCGTTCNGGFPCKISDLYSQCITGDSCTKPKCTTSSGSECAPQWDPIEGAYVCPNSCNYNPCPCGYAAACVDTPIPSCCTPANSTPPPNQTPPPGNWGSCGQCTTCGGPASECVPDPNNQCVWDPSGCGIGGKSASCSLCSSSTDAFQGDTDPKTSCSSNSPKYPYQQGNKTLYADLTLKFGETKTIYTYSKNVNGHLFWNSLLSDYPSTTIGGNGNCTYSFLFRINGKGGGSGKKANCPDPILVKTTDGGGCVYLPQTGTQKKNGGTWLCTYTIEMSHAISSDKTYTLETGNYVQAKSASYNDDQCWSNVKIRALAGTATPPPTPTPAPPTSGAWWQAVNGDVSSGGNLISRAPTGLQFMTPPILTGFPGVANYIGTYDFTNDSATTGSPSLKGWLTSSTYLGKTYNSSYFATNQSTGTVFNNLTSGSLIDGATFASGGSVSPDGYFWYLIEGDATINTPVAITGTRKVVLVVQGGSLTIKGNITIQNPGQGTFIAVVGKDLNTVGGNISIDPVVTTLNGIFLADGTASSGSGATQLAVTGSFVALGGVNLQRDLGGALNATTPAEKFTYDPRLIFTIPNSLNVSRIVWKEVAP